VKVEAGFWKGSRSNKALAAGNDTKKNSSGSAGGRHNEATNHRQATALTAGEAAPNDGKSSQ
jgi:hypothetical protein